MAAPTYRMEEPFHHTGTTKHGETGWSWKGIWSQAGGNDPIPLFCPCGEANQNDMFGEPFPHAMVDAVGAHVSLRPTQPGPAVTVPAIIPVCSACNRNGAPLTWNTKAMLLRGTDREGFDAFFGKLFLHEGTNTGPYWTEVHSVRHEEKYVKVKLTFPPRGSGRVGVKYRVTGYTYVQGKVDLPREQGSLGYVGVYPFARAPGRRPEDRIRRMILDPETYFLPAAEFSRSELNKLRFAASRRDRREVDKWWEKEEWVYEDPTKFVYDLFRKRTYPGVGVKCESRRGVVELQAPCVEAVPAQPRQMPNIMRQLTHVMVELARAHLDDNIIEFADFLAREIDFLARDIQAWQEPNEVAMAEVVTGVERMGLPADNEDN